MKYLGVSKEEAEELYEKEQKNYKKFLSEELKLDMSRGKPCSAQLDIANDLFDVYANKNFVTDSGLDVRNYGGFEGITELRKLFADLFDVDSNNVIVSDNSSLNIMYDLIQIGMQFGFNGNIPWNKQRDVKFICLVPGYDRHFAICENFGIEMISVPFLDNGEVDIDTIEALVASDSSIKGIWCVPKYSNPSGVTYSDDTVTRLAKMKAPDDFRIFWDNAYAFHGVFGDTMLKNIIKEAEKFGNPDRVLMFSSTSKITFSGAGVSVFISSLNNISDYSKHMKFATIGPNKVMQYAHFKYLKSVENVLKIMNKHGDILRPKFDCVESVLCSEFEDHDIVKWTKPVGGYFVSLDILCGSAKEVVKLAKEAGVKFTDAGATFPLHQDPNDRNIRIAPSFPPVEELEIAMQVLCCCIKLSALKKILGE